MPSENTGSSLICKGQYALAHTAHNQKERKSRITMHQLLERKDKQDSDAPAHYCKGSQISWEAPRQLASGKLQELGRSYVVRPPIGAQDETEKSSHVQSAHNTVNVRRLFSNIWLWRGVAGVLTAAVILILCIQFVNSSLAKDLPACPSLELCQSGWLYFQGKCYYLSEHEANWNTSQNFCSLHNASLLVIENLQELSFMVKITKQDPWIGLYKRNEEFFWVNGKALDNKLIEVKGSGNCAYLESKGVSASGCYLTRKWVCSLNISLAT
ncbi:C-type lectin domain family 2 member L-like [Rhynochetos jubatus]